MLLILPMSAQRGHGGGGYHGGGYHGGGYHGGYRGGYHEHAYVVGPRFYFAPRLYLGPNRVWIEGYWATNEYGEQIWVEGRWRYISR